jgi:hypothetical protein
MPPAGLPIVGQVAAGTPMLAAENLEDYLEIDRVLGDRSNLFVLRVKGDSMEDRQIYEGDYVIVRAQPWVEHRDVGVVVIDMVIIRVSLPRIHRCSALPGQLALPRDESRSYSTRSVTRFGHVTIAYGPRRRMSAGSSGLSCFTASVTPWRWAMMRSRSSCQG